MRDLRKYARQTTTHLVIGALLLVFILGDGLIYINLWEGGCCSWDNLPAGWDDPGDCDHCHPLDHGLFHTKGEWKGMMFFTIHGPFGCPDFTGCLPLIARADQYLA